MGICLGSQRPRRDSDLSDLSLSLRVRNLPSIQNFFTNPPEVKFQDKYTCSTKLLGKGGSGYVYEGAFKSIDVKIAVKKILKKKDLDISKLKLEIKILERLKHPHILALYDFFEEEDCYILVTELVEGGDLLSALRRNFDYSENHARDLFVSICRTVRYIHMQDIVHRDLKLDNIMLKSPDNDHDIKLIDFGIATFCKGPKLKERIGTLHYAAPEILAMKAYGKKVDIWSLGCILFALLTGKLPFWHEDRYELMELIMKGAYDMLPEDWIHESSEAKDLVRQILQVDPEKRPNIDDILSHPWCKADAGILSSRSLLHSLGSMCRIQLVSSLGLSASEKGSVRDIPNIELSSDLEELLVQDGDSFIII